MGPRRGTAIKNDASAELLLPRSPAPRHPYGTPTPDAGRFSPLNAPQRAALDAFLAEARPWAMKQARRAYRHLPEELHDQGFDQAAVALRTGAPAQVDRRTLYAELARHLDDELRRIHVGWCLNQARVSPRTRPVDDAPDTQQVVAAFLEEGLGGLERAVLQLEIGAGRDTSTVRAALRLPARQYARHRELGLGKLRGAIAGGIAGRVCDQHLEAVTLAATGDRDAADRLASGPERCRACAREASGLRRVLQQRLALAPWPLAIKPAGALAAKLGALGAMFGGKGAAGVAGTGLGTSTSGAKVVAALMATAAVASGGIAAVEAGKDDPLSDSAAPAAASSLPVLAPASSKPAWASGAASSTSAQGKAGGARKAERRRPAEKPQAAASTGTAPAATDAPAATAEPQATLPSVDDVAPAAQKPTETVRKTIDEVKKTVDDVTGTLPPTVADPVGDAVDGVDQTVDDVTGAVDGILAP